MCFCWMFIVVIHFIACSAVEFLIIYVNVLEQPALIFSGQIFLL
jgi:hypothetical protein